jgi:diaminohydroxyphosphoribosylaminopyrimidine deaminase/5-amino-6-(5-phosphoribosylamino)uracil reductase
LSTEEDDQRWMTRALELARQADYHTSPNPMVGAVVLDREGRLAGEGYHRRKGEPHAEQEALAAAGTRAHGGTIFTNLEPCTHAHRSPPCAEAIIDAGITRAVVAMEKDPDVRIRGSGVARLRSAGVDVAVGVLEREAQRLNEFYSWHRTTGRPFVSAKYAMTLDGKIATTTGDSRWITGAAARRHGHLLRHIHDAILVGVNTVLSDDPQLTTRDYGGPDARQPLRIVLDSKLRTPRDAKVLGGGGTLIASTAAGHVEGAEVLELPSIGGRVALEPLLDGIGRRGVISLLVEGGSETLASFLEAGLVNKVYAYVAPKLLGGRDAAGPFGGSGIPRLADAVRVTEVETVRLDEDLLITGYVVDVHRHS